MKKKYIIFLLFILAFFSAQIGFGQNSATAGNSTQSSIEDLSIYPNPVDSGKTTIYVTSKQNLAKKIEFYDVLGKQIFTTVIIGKELNIASLSQGVYILRITENNISETRKLVIK